MHSTITKCVMCSVSAQINENKAKQKNLSTSMNELLYYVEKEEPKRKKCWAVHCGTEPLPKQIDFYIQISFYCRVCVCLKLNRATKLTLNS